MEQGSLKKCYFIWKELLQEISFKKYLFDNSQSTETETKMDAADRQIILDAKTMLCKQSGALFSSLLT